MKNQSIYFPGLTGVRAIASLIVVVWHTDMFLNSFSLSDFWLRQSGLAGYAVNLFFVLSGFLITYLLLAEKTKTGKIDIKKFYLRRILRIWPLYYMGIFLSIILMYLDVINVPNDFFFSLVLYFFLLANLSYALKIAITSITPLWSVGVEEQFYAIWPWIIKKSRNVLRSLLIVIVFYFILKTILWIQNPSSWAYSFITHLRIDLMALGGIGAEIIFKKRRRVVKFVHSIPLQIIAWAVLFISILYKPIHITSFLDNEINSIFYLVILLNVSSNPKTIITLDYKILNFFGKISYGLYVYHMIVILIFLKYFDNINFEGYYYLELLIPVVIVGFTTLLATISFYYFEKPILKIKHRYEVIKSNVKS